MIQAASQTTLLSESFETDGEGTRYTTNSYNSCPTDPDFFIRTNTNPANPGCSAGHLGTITGLDGSWMWVSEDINSAGNGNMNGLISLNSLNVSGYSSLQVILKMADARATELKWESTDQIYVEYSMDGGGFAAIGLFRGQADISDIITGTDLAVDLDNNPATPGFGAVVTLAMQDFTFNIPVTGNSLQVRLRYVQDGGTEELGMDHIRIQGVMSMNDAPVLANIEMANLGYSEGGPASQITNTITISDTENDMITGGTVQITGNYDITEDELTFSNMLGVTGSWMPATGTLNLTGTTTLANYQTVLRSVAYVNNDPNDASPLTRTVSFQISDGTGSNLVSRNINVSVELNAPFALPAMGYCESFETNGEGTRYGSNHINNMVSSDVFDRFTGTMPPTFPVGFTIMGSGLDGTSSWISEDASMTSGGIGRLDLSPITITGFNNLMVKVAMADARATDAMARWENDDFFRVSYSIDGGPFSIVGAFYGDDPLPLIGGRLRQDLNLNGISSDMDGGVLSTDAMTDYTFNLPPIVGTNLTIRLEVKSNGTEELVFDNICLSGNMLTQSPPVLANIENALLDFSEGDPPVLVTNTVTVSDIDNMDMESAVVRIVNYNMGEDALSFTPAGSIIGMFDGVTGILSLTGTGSLAEYQMVLRSVTYQNTNLVNPSLSTRTISFQVNDGTDDSNIQSRQVNIIPVLNAPSCLPYAESFETDGEGTRYGSNTYVLGSDYFIRFCGTMPTEFMSSLVAIDGSCSWIMEDVISPPASAPGVITLAPFNITDYTDLQVGLKIAVGSDLRFDINDNYSIEYNIDGGGWMIAGLFQGDDPSLSDGSLKIDTDNNPATAGPYGATIPTGTLTAFTFPIPGTGNILQIRFIANQDGGTEEVAIDSIGISGMFVGTPPMVTSDPMNSTVCQGADATFSVSATGSNLTYQWQEDGMDIMDGGIYSGATASTLMLTGVSSTQNNKQYQVLVASGCGSVTSAAATLMVDEIPTTSIAGPDQTLCNTSSFTLAGNVPTVGGGIWSEVGGPTGGFSITSPGSANSEVTGVPSGGSVTLRWTISNGICQVSTDDVVLTNDAPPSTSSAGFDQAMCNTSVFTLMGNLPTVGGGIWTEVGGPTAGFTITTPGSATSGVTGVPLGGSVTLRWTISNGVCPASIDDVVLTNDESPTIASAGTDQTLCNTSAFTLSGNVPTVGTGTWTEVGGPTAGFVVTTPGSATSGVTGVPLGGSVTLRWTITNGACPASTDDVVLTNDAPPSASSAGPDQALCNTSAFTLAGNVPITGIGMWSEVGGPTGGFAITSPGSATSGVSGVPSGGSVSLRWTISNGVCPASTDDVTLNNDKSPTTSSAGPDQTLCNTSTFTLAGNVPSVGTGMWTEVGGPTGGFAIATPGSAASGVTGVPLGGSVNLRWTISNGSCPSSSDDVTLTNDSPPSISAAGPDQTLCNTSAFTLAGNVPVVGTGMWAEVGGPTGGLIITAPSSAGSGVTGVTLGGMVTLRWTISNGVCPASSDDIVLTNDSPPSISSAGPDQTLCNTSVSTLMGNAPTVGNGHWIEVGGPTIGFNITTPNSATSGVTGVPLGGSVTLRWTISNGVCPPSTDDVVLTNNTLPIVALTAPADLCVDAVEQIGLGGGTPAQGSEAGDIGIYSGPGVTDDANGTSYKFNPSAAGVGIHVIIYTYTDGNGCSSMASDMIEVFALPIVTFTAPADLCLDAGVQSGLTGGTPTGGIYSGPGVTDHGNGMTYSFDPMLAGIGFHIITYSYVDVNGCAMASSDEVGVGTIPASPPIITGASTICPSLSNLEYSIQPVPNALSYSWSFSDGSAVIHNNGNEMVSIDFSNNFAGGTLSVVASNTCGASVVANLNITKASATFCELTSCFNENQNITVTNALLLQLASPDVYKAINRLESTATIQALRNITFKAGTEIILEPPFNVELGATFIAEIEPCIFSILNK